MIPRFDGLNPVFRMLLQDAAGASNYTPPAPLTPPEIGPILWYLAAMVIFVALIVAGLVLAIWLWRRPTPVAANDRQLRLLQQVVLSRRGTVQLVEAAGVWVVVGADPQGVKFCHLVNNDFSAWLPSDNSRDEGPSVEEITALLASSRTAA